MAALGREECVCATKPLLCCRSDILPLLAVAAMLHLTLAVGIYAAGWAALFPGLIDGNAVLVPLASDSHSYRSEAAALAGTLTNEGVSAWTVHPAPFHIKLISLSFALFRPLFGFSLLSVEPLNLTVYLIILCLVFKLGEEVGNRRAGMMAAVAVAVWPSFLLHTTQFLKDPLYIANALAIILIVSTWLTRTYQWRTALFNGVVGGLLIVLLGLIRDGSGMMALSVVSLGGALLIIRQLKERRVLAGNLFSATLMFVVMAACLIHGASRFQGLKPVSVSHFTMESSTRWPERVRTEQDIPSLKATMDSDKGQPITSRLRRRADLNAARIGRLRHGFTHDYPAAGSTVDGHVQFANIFDLISYLPRALALGLFAPFPQMWFASGVYVGAAGRLLGGLETLILYVIEFLALSSLWQTRRRLTAWLL